MKRALLAFCVLAVLAVVSAVGTGCDSSPPSVAENLECGPEGCPITGAPADMLDPAAYARSAAPVNPVEDGSQPAP